MRAKLLPNGMILKEITPDDGPEYIRLAAYLWEHQALRQRGERDKEKTGASKKVAPVLDIPTLGLSKLPPVGA